MADRLRLGLVGTGWISTIHLAALERLARTELVGVVSGSAERAAAITTRWGGRRYQDLERMLDDERPDVVYVCLPPHRSPPACRILVERGVPFLTEKPLAAAAADAERVGALLRGGDLVTAVGYHLRALPFLPLIRERLAARPARLVMGRWTGGLPPPPWWRHVAESGGQVVEQATHLFDLSRSLVGEAEVVAASSGRWPRDDHPDADMDDVAAALLRYRTGAIGSFVNTSILASGVVELDFLADSQRTTIRMHRASPIPQWSVTIDDGTAEQAVHDDRDPYQTQAAVFLDAVVDRAPSRVLSSYADALVTDRLVRSVVAATGSRG
jgi:myo-inositol 2-dehydrogenase/D-chiro-inositol 1-dehydrogenase